MRKIQTLLLSNKELFNSVQFKYDKYVGCPINSVRTFSDLGYDEIFLLKVASYSDSFIDYEFLSRIVRASTVPITYGGGINSVDVARKLFDIGFDKLLINSFQDLSFETIEEISALSGVQSLAFCVNYSSVNNCVCLKRKKDESLIFDTQSIYNIIPNLVKYPVGEVLFQDVKSDGCMSGYDINLVNFLVQSHFPFQSVVSGGVKGEDYAKLKHNEFVSFATGTNGIYFGELNAILPNI